MFFAATIPTIDRSKLRKYSFACLYQGKYQIRFSKKVWHTSFYFQSQGNLIKFALLCGPLLCALSLLDLAIASQSVANKA